MRYLFPKTRYLLPLGEDLINALKLIRTTCRNWVLTKIFCELIDRDISFVINFNHRLTFAFKDFEGGSLVIEMQKEVPSAGNPEQPFLHFPIVDMIDESTNLLSNLLIGEHIPLEDICNCNPTNGSHQQYFVKKRKGLITDESITCQSQGVVYGLYCCGRIIYVGETNGNLVSSNSQITDHAKGNTSFRDHINLHDINVNNSDDCNLFFQKYVSIVVLQKPTCNQIANDPFILGKWKMFWMFTLRTLTCFTNVQPLGCNEH